MNNAPQIVQMKIAELRPYDKNPRDNKKAIDAVAKSIEDFGALVPIVVDKDNVIVAGHTRWAAAQKLKLESFPVIRAEHLNDKQVNAFRLIDNKTAELAIWDFDLLAGEIADLQDSGIDFGQFGWTQEEIDCLSSITDQDCLDTDIEGEDNALRNRHAEGGDGVNAAANTNKGSNIVSRDPKSVRVAVGEINFFVDIEHYREWAHEVRKRNGFDMQRVIDDLAGKLGLQARPFTARAPRDNEADMAAMEAAKEVEAQKSGKSRAEINRDAAIAKRRPRPEAAPTPAAKPTRGRPNPERALKDAVKAVEA